MLTLARMARIIVALGVLLAAPVLAADPPPPARCSPAGEARVLELGVHGVVARIAAARDGERIVLAARVLPLPNERRAYTRILVGEVGPEGAWAVAPREVFRERGRHDGALEVAAAGGARRLVVSTAAGPRMVELGTESHADVIVPLAPQVRGARFGPFVIARGAGFTLVWTGPSLAVVRHYVSDRAPGAPHAIPLPHNAVVASAAAGPEGDTGLVVRTPGRRYVIARIDAEGSLHWTGNGPAGCERDRCPPVTLLPAPGGYVASWENAPTPDGLGVPGGWSLDARGHVRGRPTSFIPMANGTVIAGPQGQALALQLGRPIVLRGGERPVALPAPPLDAREFPSFARAWISDALGPGIEVVSVAPSGRITLAALRCTAP